MSSRSSPGPRGRLAVVLISGLALILLACRLQMALSGAQATVARPTRAAAARPTFTPPPVATDTPEASLTPVPTETPIPEPTDTPTRRPTARPVPTRTPTPMPTATPLPQPTATATTAFQYTASQTTCTAAANAGADTVTGTIKDGGAVAVGRHVRASAGMGGEPISDDKATDSTGAYKIIFVCGGAACNGDFWVWVISFDGTRQLSPFVKFSFSDSCRRGVVNFSK